MEVTKTNFDEVFPHIVRDIENSSFLCIDGEFTGLNNGYNVNAFDTPAESYHKIRAGSMDFLFIQFGLSIFTQDDKTGRYKNRTYVFYLFPRPINRLAPDTRFLCQTSSIDFLISNNFDFNKLFREGIPYLNSSDESQLAEAMEIKRNYRTSQVKESSSQTIPIPKQYKPAIDNAMNKIEKVIKGKESEVKIEKCSGFVRKLIYQTFEEKYKNIEGILLKSEGGGMYCKRGVEVVEEKDAKELAAAVGFSKVVREISAKGKLVVGHNMLLDICHLVQRFLDPLPSDYHEFKEMLHTLFPKIIDTKLICAEETIKQNINGSTLESLMGSISKPPFHYPEIDGEEGYSYSLSDVKYHNAGYDAFITGTVFLSFIRALDPDNKTSNLKNCKPIEKCMNKLFLMKAPDTCIDLVNPDPEPSRDHVFHISFPKYWNATNIQKLFSPFGSTQLFWLSDTTAWVSLFHRDESHRVVKTLENSSKLPSGVSVLSYQRFMGEKGAAISPRPNKRKHGSESVNDEGKRRKGSMNDMRTNGSSRKISPIPEETGSSDSEMKKLEESASIAGSEFDINQSWD